MPGNLKGTLKKANTLVKLINIFNQVNNFVILKITNI